MAGCSVAAHCQKSSRNLTERNQKIFFSLLIILSFTPDSSSSLRRAFQVIMDKKSDNSSNEGNCCADSSPLVSPSNSGPMESETEEVDASLAQEEETRPIRNRRRPTWMRDFITT
ncbi:hypothetical protein PIB30_077844 [Stylosanthes scabra]|uniref:Uncharacterized protein n=1 Tax=Stylosanthes scabra TaxID=79078 RepID=A0ABU6UPJ8_9FABA|nr:hypothetical protein [Stylosanthes scabra]